VEEAHQLTHTPTQLRFWYAVILKPGQPHPLHSLHASRCPAQALSPRPVLLLHSRQPHCCSLPPPNSCLQCCKTLVAVAASAPKHKFSSSSLCLQFNGLHSLFCAALLHCGSPHAQELARQRQLPQHDVRPAVVHKHEDAAEGRLAWGAVVAPALEW